MLQIMKKILGGLGKIVFNALIRLIEQKILVLQIIWFIFRRLKSS